MQPPAHRSRFRRALPKLLAAACGTVVALVVVEVALRWSGYNLHFHNGFSSFHEYDPDVGIRGVPEMSGRFTQSEFDVGVTHDARGFRVAPVDRDPPDEPGKVLWVLGDSHVWGWGVEADESIVGLLDASLADLRAANFGVCGTGTVTQSIVYEKHVAASVQPGDIVVLCVFCNDLSDNIGHAFREFAYAVVGDDGEVSVVPPPAPSFGKKLKKLLKLNWATFNLAAYAWDRMKADWKADSRAAASGVEVEVFDEELSALVFRHYLDAMRDDAQSRGAQLGVVFLPFRTLYGEGTPRDVEHVAQHRSNHRTAIEVLRETDIPFVDLLPALRQQSASERMTFVGDFHLGAAGHRVVAEGVTQLVRSL
ncbi:MAG: GDSL-type esterase/lipase family protein [Planctomycetota bacterium]